MAHPPEADALLERTIVSSKSGPLGKVEHLEPFDLEQGEGQLVRVQLAQQLRIEPVETREAKWGDVENEPELASLRGNAPGPHVEVEVRHSRVENGAKVELLVQDDDVEHVFSATTGGHRDAPTRQLATVTARVVASGPDAATIVDRMLATDAPKPAPKEKPRAPSRLEPTPSLTPVGLLVVATLLLLAGIGLKFTALSVDLALLGVILAIGGITSWALARVPQFISDGRVVGKLGDSAPGRVVVILLIFPISIIGMVMFADVQALWQDPNPTNPTSVYNVSWVSTFCLAAWSLSVAYVALTRGNSEARLFRVLLGAPALPAEGVLSRTWGSFEGTVRDPTPVKVEGEAVAIVHVISEEVVSGSDPNIFTERVLSKGTFFVDALDGSGRQIEINPDGAIWASSVALSVPKADKNGKTVVEHIRAVPLRGNVLVAGRVDRKLGSPVGHVSSGGHESLLFVAVREGHSARSECRSMLVLRRLAFLVALGGVAIAVGTVLFVEPHLPKFNMPEGGD